MDARPRRQLAEFVRKDGVGLADEPSRVRALLLDTCPDSRIEVGLLVTAAEDEIPARLIRSSDSVFREGEVKRAIADLQQTRRFDRQAATWSVHSWGWALGILEDEPEDDLTGDEPQQPSQVWADVSGPAPDPTGPPSGAEAQPAGWSGRSASGGAAWSAPSGPTSGPPGPPSDGSGLGYPWSGPPAGPPTSPSSGLSGPPSGPSVQGTPTVPPPRTRRSPWPWVGVVGAVVVVGAVGLAILDEPPVGPLESTSITTQSGASPSNTNTEPVSTSVAFTIVDSLGDWQVAEEITVYLGGREMGTLFVDGAHPTDTLSLTGEAPGSYEYQLDITVQYFDENGDLQVGSIGSSGYIDVSDGSAFAVLLVQDGGSYRAVLRET